MPNILKGEASFRTTDGREWHLVLDFYAFAVAQQALGLPKLEDLFALIKPVVELDKQGKLVKVVKEPDALALGAVLCAGLSERHPEVTQREATNMLAGGEEVGGALGRAMQGAFPDAVPKASAEGNGRGTGTKPKRTGQARG